MRTLGTTIVTVALVTSMASGALAEEELPFGPMTPARVSGELAYLDSTEANIVAFADLMYTYEGGSTVYALSSDDPRLGGTATSTFDGIGWYPPALVATGTTTWTIEDVRGSWTGGHRDIASTADVDPLNAASLVVLTGRGAYEGLTAHLRIDTGTERFVGAITPEQMPELPDDWMEIYQTWGGAFSGTAATATDP